MVSSKLRMHFERFHDNEKGEADEEDYPLVQFRHVYESHGSEDEGCRRRPRASSGAIAAYSTDKAAEVASDADCILLGPQIQFQADEVRAACPGVPVAVIDMVAYGTMDGNVALVQAKSLMGEN